MRLITIAIFFLSVVAMPLPTIAQDVAIDPPMTKQEKQAIKDMRKQWKEAGMPAMTPEQEVAMIQRMRDTQAQMMGRIMGMRAAAEAGGGAMMMQPPQQPVAQPPAQTSMPTAAAQPAIDLNEALARQSAEPQFTRFERIPDGFEANDRPYLDVDGVVTDFGGDTWSGDVTYFVDDGRGSALVKHANVNSAEPAFVVGTLSISGDRTAFQGRDGTTAAGDKVIPTRTGMIFTRDNSLVRYEIGKQPTAFALPKGYVVAEYQNGDVSGTGYLLLERATSTVGPVGGVGNAVGHLFGARDKAVDYALFNVESGNIVTLNMNKASNTVGQGTGCRRQNAFVNKCSGWKHWDSIWQPNGDRNTAHYYWTLTWQQTKFGPVAVARENGSREVNVITLDNGERFNAFQRGMGVNEFKAELTEDGSMRIDAKLAFKRKSIEDIGALLGASTSDASQPKG